MLTRREKLLIRPWQQRRYNHHRRKVQSALPAIDVGPPPERRHVCYKLKKQQNEQERAVRIEKDNCRLLQRMGTIMRTKRLDNEWSTPPPSFLHRVGIYYEPDITVSPPQEATPPISSPKEPVSRKSRCLACNPQRIKPTKAVPEERIPWEENHTASRIKSSSTTTTQVTSSGSRIPRDKNYEDVLPRRIILSRGQLKLAVGFPADTTIRLEDGPFDRLLQREYCECKALKPSKQ